MGISADQKVVWCRGGMSMEDLEPTSLGFYDDYVLYLAGRWVTVEMDYVNVVCSVIFAKEGREDYWFISHRHSNMLFSDVKPLEVNFDEDLFNV